MSLLGRLGLRRRSRDERRRLEAEMREELERHLELATARNRERGMDADEAARQARLAFGPAERIAEECRESWGARRLDELRQDLRLGLRSLARSPGYAAAVVITLALGIGANTAVFSVVRGVLLRPLPYGADDRLVTMRQPAPRQGAADLGFSVLELDDYRAGVDELEAVSEYHSMNFTLYGGSEPLRVQTGVVSANYFDLLEVQPLLGRTFRPGEDELGAEAVLVLSHRFWKEAFGGDPGVVGRPFQMNDRPHTVVGVLPPLPAYPDANDVFMPASACPFRSNPQALANRGARAVSAVAKLRRGATLDGAVGAANGLVGRLQRQFADAYPQGGGVGIELAPLRDEMTRGARRTFLLLLGIVSLILLIACANVANLALARLADRGREMALRAALGGGRRRLLRQLLTESTLLALLGGALGLLLALLTKGMLVGFAARFSPRAEEITIDGTVLFFTLLVSVATGLVFGSLPGLPKADALARSVVGESSRTTASRRSRRLRTALVVGQLALSFVLLVVAALALRSLWRLNDVDAGFRSENVLTAQIHLNWSTYLSPEHQLDRERVSAFHERLAASLGELPGVTRVGNAWTVPLNAAFSNGGQFLIEGRQADDAAPIRAVQIGASRDYFEAVAVPVLQGEPFRGDERGQEPLVTMVSREFARRYFPNESPIGRRISGNDGRSWRTIVAVVGDVRQSDLRQEPEPTAYLPFTELPGFSSYVFVRALGDPRPLERELRRRVLAADAQAAVSDVATLEHLRTDSLAAPRLATALLSLFAFLALAISATGLGGVLAYQVAQRTQEIGVRMALGAAPRRVLAEIVGDGLRTTLLGLALGIAGSLATARLLTGMLFGVSPTDTLCIAASAATLLLTAFVASLLPARRAVSVQPVRALRV
ncbi:MAG: ABC transporter permease [Thermoanaerobaculia bacterium]|nr:ABC transporter permease [Thermoanaerobaculia bacterium]